MPPLCVLAIDLHCRDGEQSMMEISDQLLGLGGIEVKAIPPTPL